MTTEKVRAHFQPEAWINDYAVSVDDEGPDEWDLSPEYASELTADTVRWDLDYLQSDPAAPEWVREWRGPFTIELVPSQDNDTEGED